MSITTTTTTGIKSNLEKEEVTGKSVFMKAFTGKVGF